MNVKRFSLWLSPEESEALKKKAKKERRTQTNFIKINIFNEDDYAK
jgi:predicted DNA-binding protein